MSVGMNIRNHPPLAPGALLTLGSTGRIADARSATKVAEPRGQAQ